MNHVLWMSLDEMPQSKGYGVSDESLIMSPADGALPFAGRRQCWDQEGRRRYISNCEDTGAQGRHQGRPSVSINKYSIACTILERKPRLTLRSHYAKKNSPIG